MRTTLILSSLSTLLVAALPACSPADPAGTGTGTDSEGSSGGSSSTTTSSPTSTSEPGGACIPGQSVACACPNGGNGAQVCNPDGSSYSPCECADPTTSNPTTSNPTTADPSTTGDVTATGTTGEASATTDGSTGGGSTGEPGSSTGVGSECMDTVTFELTPDQAALSGDWELGMSMLGEGQIVNIPNPQNGTEGSILFEPEIPCDGTWYIWVRVIDQGNNDSYFATLDGEPNPEAIFEGDCTQAGMGYKWARLNWREQGAPACEYVQDPWAPTWTAGLHAIEFSYREAQAMGRILLTNDPDLVPN